MLLASFKTIKNYLYKLPEGFAGYLFLWASCQVSSPFPQQHTKTPTSYIKITS
jgi:hypothetical protein